MKIKEKINRLKEAGFIYEIEHTEWVSPLVVVPKKNGKLRVCINLKKICDNWRSLPIAYYKPCVGEGGMC